ncbi:hypothetical protein FOXB_03867 [Fusarium oxysporum f. sp. conglutinans Fo5176]|uniref:Uncharacterized protein n=1 Tax=Fusarium oxysporum (strain Fo5176) TaxID=660025 RepID=F9FBU0_FUSOF|nr:hypothetical protein FOXB_03867 [Fusarium oxysporum f. sp. conglutinans Fo5176]
MQAIKLSRFDSICIPLLW